MRLHQDRDRPVFAPKVHRAQQTLQALRAPPRWIVRTPSQITGTDVNAEK
eukprot:m.361931 g.361931  ORF g.361931 m.361931 type:complete len:50 (-) comp19985_c0_seq1:38-187(-)